MRYRPLLLLLTGLLLLSGACRAEPLLLAEGQQFRSLMGHLHWYRDSSMTLEQDTFTLEITAQALSVPLAINTTTTAALVSWTGDDTNPANNSASVQVQVLPTPELSVVKIASTASADPGSTISYTTTVSNISTVAANNVVVTHQLDAFLSLRLDTFGAGSHLQFNDGSPASGLTLDAVDYSQDNGVTWTYVPVSGGGGAAPGYDSSVTHIRATLTGSMTSATGFVLIYDARLN